MKQERYHARYADPEEIKGEIIDRVLDLQNKADEIRDLIAQQTDALVEAIMREQLEEATIWLMPTGGTVLDMMVSAGEKKLLDGTGDIFACQVPLADILDNFEEWRQVKDYESADIRTLLASVRRFTANLETALRVAENNEA